MLTIHDHRPLRTCQGTTRREFLRVGGLGLGGLTLSGLLSAAAHARGRDFIRDKSVVLLFLQGGPPQIEMFDPKMNAPAEIRSCTGEVQTRLPGVTFGGTFPKLGAASGPYCRRAVVRLWRRRSQSDCPCSPAAVATEATMGAQFARLAGANHPVTAMPTHSVVLAGTSAAQFEAGRADRAVQLRLHPAKLSGGRAAGPRVRRAAARRRRRADEQSGVEPAARAVRRSPEPARATRRASIVASTHRRDLEAATASEQQAVDVLLRGIADAFDLSKEAPRPSPATTPATCSAWRTGTRAASTTTACETSRA